MKSRKISVLLCCLLALLAIAAGKRISDFTDATIISNTNVFELDIGSASRKVSMGTLATNLSTNGAFLSHIRGGTNPAALIELGNAPGEVEQDGTFVLRRSIDDSVVGHGHGFSDASVLTRASMSAYGYNSYDSVMRVIGVGDMQHIVPFQDRNVYTRTGTIATAYSFISQPYITGGGAILSRYAFAALDVGKTGGTIGYNVGYYCGPLAAGTNNYGLYINPKSYFAANVGIGTTTPASLLHVEGPYTASPANLDVITLGSAGLDVGNEIRLKYSLAGTTYPIAYIGSGLQASAADSFLTFGTRNSSALAEKMRLTRDGNLGIATNTPEVAFHVHGSAAVGIGNQNTNATAGFFYWPTMTNAPLAVPTTVSGHVPGLVDTNAAKLWFYVNGAWKWAQLN